MTRTYKGKDDGEKHEAMEESEHHNQEEHFEEDHEGVIVRGGKKDNSQEGGEAAIEHSWSHLEQRVLYPEYVRTPLYCDTCTHMNVLTSY